MTTLGFLVGSDSATYETCVCSKEAQRSTLVTNMEFLIDLKLVHNGLRRTDATHPAV